MPESREVFIGKLMAHINHLTMVPKVQVERAVAPILGLFIAQLLSEKWDRQADKQIEVICEEFTLRKPNGSCQSTNIDWLLYDTYRNELIFLELKTVDTSFDPGQKKIYLDLIRQIGENGLSFLEKDIEKIMNNSLEPEKYQNTLNCISNCIERNPRYSECRKAKLVYLAPEPMRNARKDPSERDVEWLIFHDLPKEISGELALE